MNMNISKAKKEKTTISSRMNENAIRLIEGIAVYENRTVSKITCMLIESGLRQYMKNNTRFRNIMLDADLIPDFKAYVKYLCDTENTSNDSTKSIFDFINEHSGGKSYFSPSNL